MTAPVLKVLESNPGTDPDDVLWQASVDGVTRRPKPAQAAAQAELKARDATDPHDIDPIADPEVFGVDVTGEGDNRRPLPTMPALEVIAKHYRLRPRRNRMTHKDELWWQGAPHIYEIEWLESVASRERYPVDAIGRYLPALARRDGYHPAGEWIQSRVWDGRDRLPELLATLTPEPEGHAATCIRKWLRGAAALACLPEPAIPGGELGCIMQGALILKGQQGIRKSSWIAALSPLPEWVHRELQLDDLQNKDMQIKATSRWLAELSEIDRVIRRNDAESLKSWITTDKDEIRAPYGKKSEVHHRRTAYIGSTNQAGFLVDETGNRRWWAIDVTWCDVEALIRLGPEWLQQLWAQAWAEWRSEGPFSHSFTEAELDENERLNAERHREKTAEELAMLDRFDVAAPDAACTLRLSATEVCELLELDIQRPATVRNMGYALGRYFKAMKVKGRTVYAVPSPQSKPNIGR